METNIRDSNGVDDRSRLEVPESQGVSALDTQAGLQDRKRHDEVRGQDKALLPVNRETVGGELLSQNVKSALNIFRPFVDDVEVRIRLNESTRGRSKSR